MVSATGWTWDYCEWQVDIPRLAALNRNWRRFPPPAIQLTRIAARLGIDTQPAPAAAMTESDNQQASMLMEMFPSGELPKILTPEEYLEQKKHVR